MSACPVPEGNTESPLELLSLQRCSPRLERALKQSNWGRRAGGLEACSTLTQQSFRTLPGDSVSVCTSRQSRTRWRWSRAGKFPALTRRHDGMRLPVGGHFCVSMVAQRPKLSPILGLPN
jgi:hypothetical protein